MFSKNVSMITINSSVLCLATTSQDKIITLLKERFYWSGRKKAPTLSKNVQAVKVQKVTIKTYESLKGI